MNSLPRRIEDFRRRGERFLEELSEERYRSGAGLSSGRGEEQSGIAAIYRRYKGLASPELFAGIRRLADSPEGPQVSAASAVEFPTPEDKRRMRLLLSFAAHFIAGDAAKEIEDEKIALESDATVRLPWSLTGKGEPSRRISGGTGRSLNGGRDALGTTRGDAGATVSYRLSAVLLENEPDSHRRKIIGERRREVHRQLTPVIARLLEKSYASFTHLGYRRYADAIQELDRLDLRRLRDAMKKFLAETEEPYRKALSEAFEKRLGVPLQRAHKRDIGYLFRASGLDPIFPAERLIPAAEQTLNKMGLDLYAGGRIRMDMERRPKKSPRAFCAPLKVPDRVVLVIMPSGGASDYRAFLHELGHALHFANVAADAPFEYRWLGDASVTESFAMLFEHLRLNRGWLMEYVGGEAPDGKPVSSTCRQPHEREQRVAARTLTRLDDYLRLARLQLFYMVRRYAGKLAYELALHDQAETEDKRALYSRILTDACLVDYPKDDYLVDLDMHFYCARYLRAWVFEANLSALLEKEFGEKWFHNPSAGTFLLDLWKDGQKFTIEELEQRLGFAHLDIRPLIQRLTGMS